MKNNLKWLGKKMNTWGFNNQLFVKVYNNGVIITKKKEGRIVLNSIEVGDLIMATKDISPVKWFMDGEVMFIGFKFPEIKEFVDKFAQGKVSNAELLKIKEIYNLKNKIVDTLQENGRNSS